MAVKEYILGIDYGSKRVGVAIAHQIARLPRPLTTLPNTPELVASLKQLVESEHVDRVVVGVPRQMDGSESTQSQLCEAFAKRLSEEVAAQVFTADETLTSEEAEAAFKVLGKNYVKSDIDAMSAALILERFFEEQGDSYGI